MKSGKPDAKVAARTRSATPTLSWGSEDVGSPKPFNLGRSGSPDGAWARQIRTQEAEDSGSGRAEFQAGLRVRGLPVPLVLCVSYLHFLRMRRRRLAQSGVSTQSTVALAHVITSGVTSRPARCCQSDFDSANSFPFADQIERPPVEVFRELLARFTLSRPECVELAGLAL
jgi:hypothetical protein